MNFIDSIKSGFRNYVTFRGRSTRSEYWYWVLFMLLAGMVAGILDMAIFPDVVIEGNEPEDGSGPIGAIIGLILFLPGWAVYVRRLHDVNRSGWWMLIMLTVIGGLLLLYWSVKKGTDGENKFGPPAPQSLPPRERQVI